MARRFRPNRPQAIHQWRVKRARRQCLGRGRRYYARCFAIALLALPTLSNLALAQAAPAPTPQAAPPPALPTADSSLTDLKAAAYDAQKNAAAAQQESEQAAKAL